MSDENDVKKKATLSEEEISTAPSGVRRGMLAALGATVLGAASKALGGCIVQQPQPAAPTPVYAQPAGGAPQTGITDGDSGQWADPGGGGRGRPRGVITGLTDSDSGQWADPAQQGRGHYGRGGSTGLTDSDSGSYSDPVGNGRGTARLGYTGLTDSDGGSYADQAGHGRGRRW